MMDNLKAKKLLEELINSIAFSNGVVKTGEFEGLRQVDAKVREAKMIISDLPGFGQKLAEQMESDLDFQTNSRRVRLESLFNYCNSALTFLNAGVLNSEKKKIYSAPDLSKLTSIMPEMDKIIQDRWLEVQKCQHAGAYLSSIIMMGSILEALLLARSSISPNKAYIASAAPKDKNGKNIPIHDWTLNALIDVAAEIGWIKIDRKNFGHALRDSRNVVHPWHHVKVKADFDKSTSEMCWHVLKASVDDLLKSI